MWKYFHLEMPCQCPRGTVSITATLLDSWDYPPLSILGVLAYSWGLSGVRVV